MNSDLPAFVLCVLTGATLAAACDQSRRMISPFTRAEKAPRAGMLHGGARVSSATALADPLLPGAPASGHFA